MTKTFPTPRQQRAKSESKIRPYLLWTSIWGQQYLEWTDGYIQKFSNDQQTTRGGDLHTTTKTN